MMPAKRGRPPKTPVAPEETEKAADVAPAEVVTTEVAISSSSTSKSFLESFNPASTASDPATADTSREKSKSSGEEKKPERKKYTKRAKAEVSLTPEKVTLQPFQGKQAGQSVQLQCYTGSSTEVKGTNISHQKPGAQDSAPTLSTFPKTKGSSLIGPTETGTGTGKSHLLDIKYGFLL